MRRLPLLIALASLAGVLFLLYRTSVPASHVGHPAAIGAHAEEEHEEIEVAVSMGRLQRFHQKWWLAGKAGNAELARFYLHEMEEAMEMIADGHVMDEGVNVSEKMETYGVATVNNLAALLDSAGVGAMHAEASTLVKACNSCHMATKHAYIRIKVPDTAAFPDQDFAPNTQ
ncbi:MAG: hypothetical protein IPL52_04170 [Flavobacteriales bacterium]|nr:hypothetical protein [Flavobacteriales bacterium]